MWACAFGKSTPKPVPQTGNGGASSPGVAYHFALSTLGKFQEANAMPKEVVAALIGIAGVIVSAFVSWMVSKSQVPPKLRSFASRCSMPILKTFIVLD